MWALNVRFPDETKGEVELALARLNSDPRTIGKVSKNDLIAFAVERTCRDIVFGRLKVNQLASSGGTPTEKE